MAFSSEVSSGNGVVTRFATQPRTIRSASASPWRFTALEIRAAAALRAKDEAKARDMLTRIADDPGAPTSLRARATEMLQALGG